MLLTAVRHCKTCLASFAAAFSGLLPTCLAGFLLLFTAPGRFIATLLLRAQRNFFSASFAHSSQRRTQGPPKLR
ncbi:hypothetical protein B0O99DRAFT_647409 [Bisporella sp. PMI_857]|nr:hypothetical protein B0O99DRAFT_647409 [Bisporella sp. PMI_857]